MRHAFGEFGSTDSVGKSWIVIESFGDSRLPSGSGLFHDDDAVVLASGVNSGRESSWATSNDDDVVLVAHGFTSETNLFRKFIIGWFGEKRTIAEHDGWNDALAAISLFDLKNRIRMSFEINPRIGHSMRAQELFGSSTIGTPRCAVNS